MDKPHWDLLFTPLERVLQYASDRQIPRGYVRVIPETDETAEGTAEGFTDLIFQADIIVTGSLNKSNIQEGYIYIYIYTTYYILHITYYILHITPIFHTYIQCGRLDT